MLQSVFGDDDYNYIIEIIPIRLLNLNTYVSCIILLHVFGFPKNILKSIWCVQKTLQDKSPRET